MPRERAGHPRCAGAARGLRTGRWASDASLPASFFLREPLLQRLEHGHDVPRPVGEVFLTRIASRPSSLLGPYTLGGLERTPQRTGAPACRDDFIPLPPRLAPPPWTRHQSPTGTPGPIRSRSPHRPGARPAYHPDLRRGGDAHAHDALLQRAYDLRPTWSLTSPAFEPPTRHMGNPI